MNDDKIWKISDSVWETITEGYNGHKKICPDLIFHDEKKEEFDLLYKEKYMDVMEQCMADDTDVLDSHKQAALLTLCCLQLDIIEFSKLPQDNDDLRIFPQLIAINVGLSYMLQCLNDSLKEKSIKKQIERYYFPIAIACNTPYEKIVCRILYLKQHDNDMKFNVLDVLELADRYFLLEYINLLQHEIEPFLLKDTLMTD